MSLKVSQVGKSQMPLLQTSKVLLCSMSSLKVYCFTPRSHLCQYDKKVSIIDVCCR
jgi:hypothetical protein